jgi:PAS domain S-box-containing protein
LTDAIALIDFTLITLKRIKMEEKKREIGIDLMGDASWGTHFCLFYQTKQDLIDVLLPYFKAGLENNEFCIWLTSEPLDEMEVREVIGKVLPHFDRYLERGQIEIVPYHKWYFGTDTSSLQRVRSAWVDKLDQALAKGFDGMRMSVNTAWLKRKDWKELTDYEEKVDNTIGNYPMMALCTYSLDNCETSELIDVFGKHQSALIRQNGTWQIIESSKRKEIRDTLQKKTNDLAERVKELNCLYGISNVVEKPGISLEKMLQETVDLIPPAWQYPEITGAQINLDHQTFKTKNYKETIWKQSAAVIGKNHRIGTLNICYLEERPKSEEGPFLKEKRNLINAIAGRLGNIVEHKQMGIALEESREKLTSIFRSCPDGITVSDLKGNIIECNRATLDMHGFSAKKEIIGKSALELIAPKDQQRALENMKKTLQKGSIRNREYTLITKNGSEFEGELSASVIRDNCGKPVSFVAITKDISERTRERKTLEASERHYRLLAECMSDVIWTADLQLNFTYISPSVIRLLGYRPEEVLAQKPEETLGLRSFRTMMKFVEEKKRKEVRTGTRHSDSQTVELELKRKDGSTVWVETGITFLYDAYGWPREIMGIVRDSTARKKAEERIEEYTNKLKERNKQLREETRKTKEAEGKIRQYAKELRILNLQLKAETERAREADRLKSQFLANMSHEIRTPLTVIDGAAHLLQKNSLSLEERDLLGMIRDSDKQLLQLINAILDLARIESGQVKVVKKEFLLKETVKNIISGFEFEARRKDLEIKMICPPHLPSMISTDEGKLTQILSNLISNALRFTEKGRVEVRLNKESNSSIRFSVEDTGIGIPEEKLSLIFSKFYQMDGTIRRERGSVGLGLTIVKELVGLLGGRIEVKSKPGKGSLFCFSLPCISSKERVVPDRDGNGTAPKTEERVKRGVNILVAEDDSSTYNIIRRFLEGCTISRAVDGEDVLKKIKEKTYDMILMDILMPKMDGLEATRRIREKDSDLPIIAVTARSFKADEDKCLAAGCNDYIAKPIVPQKLIAKINQYAVERLSRRQNIPAK